MKSIYWQQPKVKTKFYNFNKNYKKYKEELNRVYKKKVIWPNFTNTNVTRQNDILICHLLL